MTRTRPLARTALVLVTAGAGMLAVAACSGANGSSATPTTTASARTGGAPSGGPGGGRVPGVSGTIAAVDGRTLQVQSATEQTAVVYTAKTAITARVVTPSSALAVGDCVSVRTAGSTSAPSTSPTAANGGAAAPTGPVAASTVTILSTQGCDAVTAEAGGGDRGGTPGGGMPGGGVPGGAPPSGVPSGMPSGAPSGRPTGGPPGGGVGGFGAMGEVTGVASGSFTLASTLPRFGEGGGSTAAGSTAGGSGSGGSTASATTTPVTVTWTDDTTFLTTRSAKASSIKVGSCVRATGDTDDTGKLTATTLVLSPPVDGSCSSGVRGG